NGLLGVRPAARIHVASQATGYVFIESGYTWLLWGGGVPLLGSFVFFVLATARRGWQAAHQSSGAIGVAGIAAFVAIIVTAVLMTVGAGALAEMQTPIYKSQAEVAVYAASSAGNSAVQSYVMGTEKRVASSGAVLSVASQSLLISVGNLQHGLSITVPAET